MTTCWRRTSLGVARRASGFRKASRLLHAASLLCCAAVTNAQSQPPAPSTTPATNSPQPAATFKAATRLVTVEVVAKDHQGHAVTGLTGDDFQVFEQEVGWRKEKRPQKIAQARAISIADLAKQRATIPQVPGIYSNFVSLEKDPVPPTIMLVDALNTQWMYRAQVHVQMLKMLRTIPDDVPVAVFLLGRRLRLLQNFTTDPKLLKTALEKTSTLEPGSLAEIDPRDDPDSLSAILEDVPGAPIDSIRQFEQEAFAGGIDVRERLTIESLRSLARHVAGYPGRKNLLWISSSFPLSLNPDIENAVSSSGGLYGSGTRGYQSDVQQLANLLGDSSIAVYPIDPQGLGGVPLSNASIRTRGNMSGQRMLGTITRDSMQRNSRIDTMEAMADSTGGKVCVNDNDLGDCVRKAIEDGSYFYEIAYYPDSKEWHGEFRKILVTTKRSGIRLSYRKGYYATAEPLADPDAKKRDEQLQQAACRDLLTSTSVLVAAKSLPDDKPGEGKFLLVAGTSALGLEVSDSGLHRVDLQFAACTFDAAGKPLQFWHDAVSQELTAKEYATIQSGLGYPHVFALTPARNAVAVRLLVRDLNTGRIGSLNVPITSITLVAPSSQANGPAAGNVR